MEDDKKLTKIKEESVYISSHVGYEGEKGENGMDKAVEVQVKVEPLDEPPAQLSVKCEPSENLDNSVPMKIDEPMLDIVVKGKLCPTMTGMNMIDILNQEEVDKSKDVSVVVISDTSAELKEEETDFADTKPSQECEFLYFKFHVLHHYFQVICCQILLILSTVNH